MRKYRIAASCARFLAREHTDFMGAKVEGTDDVQSGIWQLRRWPPQQCNRRSARVSRARWTCTLKGLRFLNTPFTDPTERQYLRWLADRGLFRLFRHLSSGHPGRQTTGTRRSSIQLTSAWSTPAPVQWILLPRERDEGRQAEQAYQDFPCQAVGIFREVEDRDAESRRSFARVGHRVRFAEKVCRAVCNHSTGRIDFYLLTVITGLSLSPVQSRSWSSPWSPPSVAGTPVAVGCSCPVCVAILSRAYVAYGDPVVVLLCWVDCILPLTSFWQWRDIPWRLVRVDGARCSESALSWASRGFGGLLEIGRFPWSARRFATSELSAQELAL